MELYSIIICNISFDLDSFKYDELLHGKNYHENIIQARYSLQRIYFKV